MYKNIFKTELIQETSYHVGVGISHDSDIISQLDPHKPAIVVIDSKVADIHEKLIEQFCSMINLIDIMYIQSGEHHKTLETLENIVDFAESSELPKHGIMIAIGGGTLCDVTASAAMLFRRGVELVLMPTTLLAQLDAAVGGKNGVNHGLSKNLIGQFYYPSRVICDQNFLVTLDNEAIRGGIAEAIKVLSVADKAIYNRHFGDKSVLNTSTKADNWTELVKDSVEWKLKLLSEDPFEASSRRLLNYGHAFAHFFEEHSSFRLSHGEAVLLGMIVENEISRQLGIAHPQDISILQAYISSHLTPCCKTYWLSFSQIYPDLERLKQARRGMMNYVCIKTIGSAEIIDNIDDDLLSKAWSNAEAEILSHFSEHYSITNTQSV